MSNYRSPDVYVKEISLLPPSVAEVESAVPAFVGYTEKATNALAEDLHKVPTPITSFGDFKMLFGNAPTEDPTNISLTVDELKQGDTTTGYVTEVKILDKTKLSKYILYHAVQHFYDNGGGKCYIVSVGKFADALDKGPILEGLEMVDNEDPPTMIVIPEAINLADAQYEEVIEKMINQAADKKDRFAIIDTKLSSLPKTTTSVGSDTKQTLDKMPSEGYKRRFGAVYYPHLVTTYNYNYDFEELPLTTHTVNGAPPDSNDLSGKKMKELKNTNSAIYNRIKEDFLKHSIVLPPSAAMAGIYSSVDREFGAWKAPANKSLSATKKPKVTVNRSEQDDLNVNTTSGKSVNAILNVPGFGTLVMGGRTLDGNDNEWRYVNVRRYFNVVEESIRKSIRWALFEPNTASTWSKAKAMIENYLFQEWRDGALKGATPEQAFEVEIAEGTTMNSVDILEGRMIARIGLAVVRPAEFIILEFVQIVRPA